MAYVRLNVYYTNWLTASWGVKHSDALSYKLFAIYINNLGKKMKPLGVEWCVEWAMLLFIYYIVLLSCFEKKKFYTDERWKINISLRIVLFVIYVKIKDPFVPG